MSRCDNCRYQDDTEFDACHICNNDQDMFRPIKTNGDMLRAFEDKELARYIARFTGHEGNPDEVAYWLDWLRKEAEHA